MNTEKPAVNSLTLPRELVDHWRNVVLGSAKLSRRKVKKGDERKESKALAKTTSPSPTPTSVMSPEASLNKLMRQNKLSIENLWEIFNRGREGLGKRLISTEKTAFHYLLGFHLPNVARAYGTLLRAEAKYPQIRSILGLTEPTKNDASKTPVASPQNVHVHWTDFGSGSGAMAQAALYWLFRRPSSLKVTFELTDLSTHLLNLAREVLEGDPEFQKQDDDLIRIKTRKFALETLFAPRQGAKAHIEPKSKALNINQKTIYGVSLGYVWNELSRNPKARAKILSHLAHLISEGEESLCLIVEPATEEFSRGAMSWRDQLTHLGYKPLYPCPMGTSNPCPMLAQTKDWCFTEFAWNAPLEVQNLDRLLGTDRKHLATSSYLFASPKLWAQLNANSLMTDQVPELRKKSQKVVVGRPTLKDLSFKSGPTKAFEYLTCDGKVLGKVRANKNQIPPQISPPKEFANNAHYKLRGTAIDETL